MTIYFDMDGTLANLYVGDWLEKIHDNKTDPFDNAEVMIGEDVLKRLNKNYTLGIISWTPMNATIDYANRVRQSKLNWLMRNYPSIMFKELHITDYGIPKGSVAKNKLGILIDDEYVNRVDWKGIALRPDELESLL